VYYIIWCKHMIAWLYVCLCGVLSWRSFAVHRVMLLEFSQYLENYLWPNYSSAATDAHVLSIVVMVNEKFRERVPAWEVCCFITAVSIHYICKVNVANGGDNAFACIVCFVLQWQHSDSVCNGAGLPKQKLLCFHLFFANFLKILLDRNDKYLLTFLTAVIFRFCCGLV